MSATAADRTSGSPRHPLWPVGGSSRPDATGHLTAVDAGSGNRVWRVRVADPQEDSVPLGGGVAWADGRALRHHRVRRRCWRSIRPMAGWSGGTRRPVRSVARRRCSRAGSSPSPSTTRPRPSTGRDRRAGVEPHRFSWRPPACWAARRRRSDRASGGGALQLGRTLCPAPGIRAVGLVGQPGGGAPGRCPGLSGRHPGGAGGDRPAGSRDRPFRPHGRDRSPQRRPAPGSRTWAASRCLGSRATRPSSSPTKPIWWRWTPTAAASAGSPPLPRWEDPEDRQEAIIWSGPVLAGGRLISWSGRTGGGSAGRPGHGRDHGPLRPGRRRRGAAGGGGRHALRADRQWPADRLSIGRGGPAPSGGAGPEVRMDAPCRSPSRSSAGPTSASRPCSKPPDRQAAGAGRPIPPGVTRDRRSAPGRIGPLEFTVIDTAGLEEAFDDSLEGADAPPGP